MKREDNKEIFNIYAGRYETMTTLDSYTTQSDLYIQSDHIISNHHL